LYEAPIEVRTDDHQLLMLWPLVQGRDITAVPKGEYVELTSKLAAVEYEFFDSVELYSLFLTC
jgi:hypothetical protein